MGKVTYVHVDKGSTFSTTGPGGALIEVSPDRPFETDDPRLIAELDQVPFVKRASKRAGEEA